MGEAGSLIGREAKSGSSILVVSHFDADGLSSAGIISKALARLDAAAHVRVVKQLDRETLLDVTQSDFDLLVFTEIGSGYMDLISECVPGQKTVILDHHQFNHSPPQNIVHVNPLEFGFEGAREISGAGVTYFTAKSLSSENVDLAALAMVGALGDLQDKGEKRSLFGLNGMIVEDAAKIGCVRVDLDLILYGRETKPIHRALAHTTSPFLPGLSGEEDRCLDVLTSAGVQFRSSDKWKTVADLSQEEKKKLLTLIVEYIAGQGFPAEAALDLIGTVYTLTKEAAGTPTRDAREFASLLNACGRMGRPSLALSICLGDRGEVMSEVQEVATQYRRTLRQYMSMISTSPERISRLGSCVVVNGEGIVNENMTGTLCSLLASSSIFGNDKATVVLTTTSTGRVKISARGTQGLVERGLNLGTALQSLSQKYFGIGGGHNIAAGAEIPSECRGEFINQMDQALRQQLGQANR